MVLAYLGVPFLLKIALVPIIFLPAVVVQMWFGQERLLRFFPKEKHGAFWPLFLTGVIVPSVMQYVLVVCGALIMEALEQSNEEDGNSEFRRCLAANFSRDECRSWTPASFTEAGWEARNTSLNAVLGDPAEFPWRNWDIFGSCFFCFTIVTTIGYGTFGPATQGGRAFTCVFLLLGIPWNVYTYANLGKTITELIFGPVRPFTERFIRRALGSHADVDRDGDKSISPDEIIEGFRRAGWLKPSSAEEGKLRAAVAEFDKDGEPGLSSAEFELFVEHCAEVASAKVETLCTFVLFILSLIVFGVVLPVTEGPVGWRGIDGLYFSLITFSTVGLGDLTLSLSNAGSLHGQFEFWLFVLYSVELALLGACISSAYDLYYASTFLLRPGRLKASLLARASAKGAPPQTYVAHDAQETIEISAMS